ncbi:MAG: AAA family ATPase [Acidimicrobiales bacterium]
MGLAWITGNSGTGKSEVCDALAAKGYRTVDSDLGMAVWVNIETDEVVRAVDTGRLSQGWFEDHRWLLMRSRVEELAGAAGSQTVFLCGLVQNDEELWDLFDAKICLVLDDATIRQRLARRAGNPFGRAPAELEAVLRFNGPLVAKYAALGATLIDSSRPLDEVVHDVLRACGAPGLDVEG